MKRKKKRRYKKNPLISKRVTMFIIIIAIIIFIYNVSTNENEETASVNAFSSINEIVDEGYDEVLVSRILTQYENMAFKRKQMPPFLDI